MQPAMHDRPDRYCDDCGRPGCVGLIKFGAGLRAYLCATCWEQHGKPLWEKPSNEVPLPDVVRRLYPKVDSLQHDLNVDYVLSEPAEEYVNASALWRDALQEWAEAYYGRGPLQRAAQRQRAILAKLEPDLSPGGALLTVYDTVAQAIRRNLANTEQGDTAKAQAEKGQSEMEELIRQRFGRQQNPKKI